MRGKYRLTTTLFLWGILILITFVLENLLSYFDVAIYRIFTQPYLRLIMIGIIGGAVLPMISVIICIGVIGGILIKGSKYSGFIATFIYCLIWDLFFGVTFWSITAYSIPGFLFHLSTPFVGGYIYAGFNRSQRKTSDSSETIGNDKLINKEA